MGYTWRCSTAIPAGTKVVEKGVPIFPRLDPEVEIVYIRDQMAVTAPAQTEASQSSNQEEVEEKRMKLRLMIS